MNLDELRKLSGIKEKLDEAKKKTKSPIFGDFKNYSSKDIDKIERTISKSIEPTLIMGKLGTYAELNQKDMYNDMQESYLVFKSQLSTLRRWLREVEDEQK